MASSLLVALTLSFGFLISTSLAQQCYYSYGRSAGSAYVPCVDATPGFKSCCGLGHLCLSDNACWDPVDNVTYQYGCTDPTYQDGSCPSKCNQKYIWTGLAYCNGTSDEWICCPTDGDFPKSVAPCACGVPSARDVAFAGPATLQAYMSLPQSIGGATIYYSGIEPPTSAKMATSVSLFSLSTATASPSSTITPGPSNNISSVPSFISIGDPENTSTPSGGTASSSGLSDDTKAKIGIGIGVPVFILVSTYLLWALVMWGHRRRHPPRVPSIEEQIRPQSAPYSNRKSFDERNSSWNGSVARESTATTDRKSELPAVEIELKSPTSTRPSTGSPTRTEHHTGQEHKIYEMP